MKLQHANLIICIVILIGSLSCDQQKSRVDSEDENLIEDDNTHYNEREIAEGSSWGESEINDFIQEAAMIDKMQIQMAELVKNRTNNEAVAGYAEKLKTDHSHSLQKLQEIASTENLNIIDSLDVDHKNKIQKLEVIENEFDKRFLEMMVEAHKKDIDKYKNAIKSIAHTHPVKDWIDDNLPVLQQHQFHAQRLLDDKNIFPVTD